MASSTHRCNNLIMCPFAQMQLFIYILLVSTNYKCKDYEQLDAEVSTPSKWLTCMQLADWQLAMTDWQTWKVQTHFLRYELTSSLNFCQITDRQTERQTDRQTDRQKAMHMSPPCISTCVLKIAPSVHQGRLLISLLVTCQFSKGYKTDIECCIPDS